MVEIRNLSYIYNDSDSGDGIKDISLNINKGDFIAIVGPSGSGKTTFLNVLASVLKPTEGNIYVDGKSLQVSKSEISVMFQHCTLIPWWSLEKNIKFFVQKSHKELSGKNVAELSDNVLKKIGLYNAKDKYPSQLSGGMQQRGALGRAFAMKSKILLLDEPFGALDVNNRCQLQDLLADLVERRQKTIIMVTHDINEAIYLADRICFLGEGRLIKDYTVPIERPRDREKMMSDKYYVELKKELLELFCCEG